MNAQNNNSDDFVVLGKILAPYGIKGWNNFRVYADDPMTWLNLPTWWLIADKYEKNNNNICENSWQPKAIRQKKLRQNFSKSNKNSDNFIVQIDNCNDRNLAENYAGLCIAAPLGDLTNENDNNNNNKNDFFLAELLGMQVVIKSSGKSLGHVVKLLETGANDVLCVAKQNCKQQYLLPFVNSVVLDVDKKNNQILVEWNEDWI